MSARCFCKGSSSSSSSRDCETLLIVLRSCFGSILGPSPPAAIVKMGKGGKGKKGTSWAREVGTYAYLKNFRKGLRYQRERCERE